MEQKQIDIFCKNFFSNITDSVAKLENPINFKEAINILSETKGKIIISGIGKSGHLGKKISSTMSSLGSASCFVHLTELLHGDLGIIQKNDCLIIISNSGEAEELQYIVAYCQKNEIKIISIVRNKNSFLALNSIPLFINYDNDLMEESEIPAPIISNILTIMIGDALAVCLAKIKNFSVFDYRELHPAGKIGFITKNVSQIMTPIERVVKFERHDTLKNITVNYFNIKNRTNICYCQDNEDIYVLNLDTFIENNKIAEDLILINHASDKVLKIKNTLLVKDLNALIKSSKESYDYFAVMDNNQILGLINKNF